MGWRDQVEPVSPAQMPAPPQPSWKQNVETPDEIAARMSHDEMVNYYRTSKQGDPLADAIRKRLSQPQAGETPDQTERRLYGHMPDQTTGGQAAAAGWADAAASGGADELAAAIGGVRSWWNGDGYQKGYDETLPQVREVLRVAQEEHPYYYGGGQVGGAITQGVAMGGTPAATLGGRVAQGAALGSGQAGLYSFLSGKDGAMNRLSGVPIAMAVGGGLGAAVPLASAGLGWLKGRWVDRTLDDKARAKIADMLDSTGMTPEEAQAIAQKQGDLGMIADVNEGMQVNTGGTSAAGASAKISPPLATRRAGAPDRVRNELTDAFGSYTGPQVVKDLIKDARQPAGPAYELAKQHIVIPDEAAQTLDDLMKTYGPNSELGKTLNSYRQQLIHADGTIEDQGHIIHGIREQLDDDINSLYNQGRGKMAERLKDFRRSIDKVLKTQIPGFEEADNIWAETSRIQKAYDYGKDKILGRTHPSEVEAEVRRMTQPEFAGARAGVRDEIEMQMSQPTVNAATRADRILERNMNKQKLGNFTTPQRADKLTQSLDNEATFMDTSNLAEATRQSRTAPVSGAAARHWGVSGGGDSGIASDAAAGAATGFAIGGAHGAVAGGMGAVVGKVRQMIANALSKPSSELINRTGEMLVLQGKARDQLINDIIKRSNDKMTKAAAGQKLDLIVRTLTMGLPGLGAKVYEDTRRQNGAQ